MQNNRLRNWLSALILGTTALTLSGLSGLALADPPMRVARLGYLSGGISFSPAGENEWVHGTLNRPLTSGDRLWVTPGARAELQIGAAAVRLSGSTSVTLLNLDNRVTQLKLTQGTLNIRVRRLSPNQVFEVDTPNLALSIRRVGNYRINVGPANDVTTVWVRDGEAEVYGDGAAYKIGHRQAYSYYGNGLRDYELISQPREDEFDRWSMERDRRAERSASLRYVSSDVIGYEDLDANGRWRTVSGYGNVWVPTRVAADWAPYRDGHWSWVEPWGWTWVDDMPWGFAVSHYGRWANLSGTWGWIPGPVRQQAVYAPALVAFVGGSNFQLSIASGNIGVVAWFPLGPRDVYRPSYPVSRDYFTRVNSSNTMINTVNITNQYNTNNITNITYVNQQVVGAVVAVPTAAFVLSQSVSSAAVRLSFAQMANAPVSAIAAVAPVQRSVIGAAAPASKPVLEGVERRVVARTAPPPAPVAFAAREAALAAAPGKPLAPADVQRLKPNAPAVPAPAVIVAVPVKSAAPMASAEPSQSAQRAGGARDPGGQAGQRGRSNPVMPEPDTSVKTPNVPQAVPQQPVVPPAAKRAAVVAPAESRPPPGQRGRSEQPVTAPETVVKPQAAPQPVPQPPVAAPAEQRTPPGQRGRAEQQVQGQPAAPAPPAAAARQKGSASKPNVPGAEDKRSPEQIKLDEQQLLDDEIKGRKKN